MLTGNTFILIVWSVYWIYSVIAAITTRMAIKKVARGENVVERFVQWALIVVAFYLIFSPYLGVLAARIIPSYTWPEFLGSLIVILSLVFADWARRILANNWSQRVQSVENQKLVQRGPYKYLRHPIYAGIIGGFFGTLLVQGTYASLLALLCMLIKYRLKIAKEERFLRTLFGERYVEYQKHTWALVPFVW